MLGWKCRTQPWPTLTSSSSASARPLRIHDNDGKPGLLQNSIRHSQTDDPRPNDNHVELHLLENRQGLVLPRMTIHSDRYAPAGEWCGEGSKTRRGSMGRGGGWRRRSGSGDESVETCPATRRSAHTARGSTAGDGGGGGGRRGDGEGHGLSSPHILCAKCRCVLCMSVCGLSHSLSVGLLPHSRLRVLWEPRSLLSLSLSLLLALVLDSKLWMITRSFCTHTLTHLPLHGFPVSSYSKLYLMLPFYMSICKTSFWTPLYCR